MFRLLTCFALCLFVSTSYAEIESSKSFNVPVNSNQKLVITGFKGTIDLIPSGDSQNLRIKIERVSTSPTGFGDEVQAWISAWVPKVEKTEKAISVKFQEPALREFWERKDSFVVIPEYKIQVTGISVPTEVYWAKGVVNARDWKSALNVTLNTGEVDFSKIEGEVKAFVQSGSVKISDQKGGVFVNTYDGKVMIRNVDGQTEIENFSGLTSVDKIQGNLRLSSYNGKTKISDIKGGLNFDMKVGTLDIDDLDGSLRGENGDGTVKARISGTPDVRVRSAAGSVNLRVPHKYAAQVNVGSSEGELRIPGNIRVQRGDNMRWAVGRLQGGGEREGQIFARSQSGNIVVNANE
ncbi:MAG: hypothetical protein A4S09_04125 [Proteobacteria bacterium SG_bin7]|nr:MAG: hypothetical protein A4S09_04125 [Proteobacteria bacterium SG_bin7]